MSTISQVKTNRKKQKKLRLDGKFWTRFLVAILTLSMLAGTFYYILVFTLNNSRVDAASEVDSEDLLVRIALVYTSSVTVDYKTVTDCGFSLGYNDSDNVFTEVTTTDVKTLHIACNRNLVMKSGRYQLASNAASAEVGSYFLRMKYEGDELDNLLQEASELLPDYNVFSGLYDGKTYIMIGDFTTEQSANIALNDIKSIYPPKTDTVPSDTSVKETDAGSVTSPSDTDSLSESDTTAPIVPEPEDLIRTLIKDAEIAEPSKTAVVSINPDTNKVVWVFDDTSNKTKMGAKALQIGSSYSYIKGYIDTTLRIYDDVLECFVYDKDGYYGISVINVLPIEKYIGGVIPYEISNQWPKETLKAFAIVVRSYTIANLGRHKSSYNADLCCTANCQVYKGFASTNSRVKEAIEETKGLVATYNGSLCSTFYSSSTGGCTANVSEVWGSSQKVYGYLAAVGTPWEKYTKYGNGSWTSSATGNQLFERLEASGYTALTGAVTKIEITKFGENSSYVYSIKFYDAAGHTVTVSQINKVKSLLSPYVKSGNFVVAKAGEKVTRNNYTMLGFGGTNNEETIGINIKTNPHDFLVTGRQNFSVITSNGVNTFEDSDSEYVATSGGILEFNMSNCLDSQYYPTITGINGEKLPDILNLDTIVETETLTAQGTSGSFVFIGRGWGHGVGLSQWGTKDLGDLGYDYETIIKAYYSNIDIVSFSQFLSSK